MGLQRAGHELSNFNFHLSESEHHWDGEPHVMFQKQVLAAAEMLNPKCMRQCLPSRGRGWGADASSLQVQMVLGEGRYGKAPTPGRTAGSDRDAGLRAFTRSTQSTQQPPAAPSTAPGSSGDGPGEGAALHRGDPRSKLSQLQSCAVSPKHAFFFFFALKVIKGPSGKDTGFPLSSKKTWGPS